MSDTERILAWVGEQEEKAAKATPGPWFPEESTNGAPYFTPFWHVVDEAHTPQRQLSRYVAEANHGPEDAAFIAVARTGYPILAQMVRELVERIQHTAEVSRAECAMDHPEETASTHPPHEIMCFQARQEIRLREALARVAAMVPKEGE